MLLIAVTRSSPDAPPSFPPSDLKLQNLDLDLAGRELQLFSRLGQFIARCLAFNQSGIQPLLQRAQTPGHRRVLNRQTLCRAADRTLTRDGQEYFQIIPLHLLILPMCKFAKAKPIYGELIEYWASGRLGSTKFDNQGDCDDTRSKDF